MRVCGVVCRRVGGQLEESEDHQQAGGAAAEQHSKRAPQRLRPPPRNATRPSKRETDRTARFSHSAENAKRAAAFKHQPSDVPRQQTKRSITEQASTSQAPNKHTTPSHPTQAKAKGQQCEPSYHTPRAINQPLYIPTASQHPAPFIQKTQWRRRATRSRPSSRAPRSS